MKPRSMTILCVLFALFAGSVVASEGTTVQPPVASPGTAVVSTGPSPKLVIPAFEHSFGTIKPGTPLTYTFKVKNKGKGALEISSVTPSCGCTKGDFDKLIEPGKEGKITLTIAKTEKYSGPMVKTASVVTNDPEHQTVTLTLRANFSTQ